MDEKTKRLIKERFDALPESIQEIILSSNYEETLIEIGNKYQLNVEELGILERETTLAMMGLTPTKNFENELTRELHIDNLKGSQIVKEINEKIFLKIRELLKLMNTPIGEEPNLEEETDKIYPPWLSTNPEGRNKPDVEKDKEKNKEVLKSAGIEIMPERLELNSPSPSQGEGSGVRSSETPSILEQKLSAPVQTETVRTEHTPENLTKTGSSSSPDAKPKIPNADPYREIPE